MGNFSGKDDSGEMRDGLGGEGSGDHHHHQQQQQGAGGGGPADYHHQQHHHHPRVDMGSGGGERGPIGIGRAGLPSIMAAQQQQQQPGLRPGGLGGDGGLGPGGAGGGMMMHVDGPGGSGGMMLNDEEEEDVVPTVFKWEHGGRQVYITGTFNNWERQIPMHRSGNDFTYIHNLPKGKHAFKFIVDDEWRYAPDQRTVADMEGRINNFIDVSDFKAFNEDSSTLDIARKEDELWGNKFPDEEFTKEPPPLPPHLRQIILNKVANERDAAALPMPQHVALDHLYCTAIKDGMMVLGVTERYKTKFVTSVYYSMMP